MSKFIKYIHTIPVGTAEGLVAQAYSQIKREMAGVPEPFLIHSPSPTLLAGVWSMFRESLVAGQVRRGLKEVAAATISQINQCPWCVEAHTLALHATGDHAAARVLLNGKDSGKPNAETQAIIEWAAMTRQPGGGDPRAASLLGGGRPRVHRDGCGLPLPQSDSERAVA